MLGLGSAFGLAPLGAGSLIMCLTYRVRIGERVLAMFDLCPQTSAACPRLSADVPFPLQIGFRTLGDFSGQTLMVVIKVVRRIAELTNRKV